MKVFQSTYSLTDEEYQNLIHSFSGIPLSELCFFDIETTGLSADVSSLYLIGAATVSNTSLEICQWFADDYISEETLLASFSDYCKAFSYIVHYNGDTFDVPYLTKKYTSYQLDNPFLCKNLASIDLYKVIKPYKKLIPTTNLKLFSVEKFFHFKRQFYHSGKECIDIYVDYIKSKYYKEDFQKEKLLNLLLTHNRDDLIGTALSSQFILYKNLFSNSYRDCSNISFDGSYVKIEYHLPFSFYQVFHYDMKNLQVTVENEICSFMFPTIQATGYHFFENYKDYFYLPEEDEAMHKSVAIYVDANRRTKATKKNCYVKKEGIFLSCDVKKMKKNGYTDSFSLFSKDQKTGYLPVSDHLELNNNWLYSYILSEIK